MDGLVVLLIALSLIFFVLMFGMNCINSFQVQKEGFSEAKGEAKEGPSSVEVQVKAVLEPMDSKELCPLYKTIRSNMAKNEKAGQDISDQEVNRRVEASLALKIPGGALPCPLLNYPKAGSSDLDWLDFLQKLPSDFGARVVFMAIYAQGFLADKEKILKDALSGNGTPPVSDGFAVCSPDLADSRRAEKNKKAQACTLPEELSPEQIKEAITKLLKDLVSNKTTILKSKQIDPLIDIKPLLTQAKVSATYVTQKSEEAQGGTLQMDGPITMQPKAAA